MAISLRLHGLPKGEIPWELQERCAISDALREEIRVARKRGANLKQIASEAGVDHSSLTRYVVRSSDLDLPNINALGSRFNLHIVASNKYIHFPKIVELFGGLHKAHPNGVSLRSFLISLVRAARSWDRRNSLRTIARWTGVSPTTLSTFLNRESHDLCLRSAEQLLKHFHLALANAAEATMRGLRRVRGGPGRSRRQV